MIKNLIKWKHQILFRINMCKTRIQSKSNTVRSSPNKGKHSRKRKYFIIRFEDKMHCGWTVWERIVLYNSIYAVDHKMIPVVDMQSSYNIYLEENEIGQVNAWDKFYRQPAGVGLEEALLSNDYILGDASQKWFDYVRYRKKKLSDMEYLRCNYQKFISYNKATEENLIKRYDEMLASRNLPSDAKLLGICLRGTDYKRYHHSKQPTIDLVVDMAKSIYEKYNCDGIFLATEDREILECLNSKLSEFIILSYKAGEVKETNGYVGDVIRQSKSANNAALDYLTVLYALDRCECLFGGLCGATIVAQYKRKQPYKYCNIMDLHESY